MRLLGHEFGKVIELRVFLNLGGRLLDQESQVGLQLEDLCRVVRVNQLERLLKVKDGDIRESVFKFLEVALHSSRLLGYGNGIQARWPLVLCSIHLDVSLRRRSTNLHLGQVHRAYGLLLRLRQVLKRGLDVCLNI